MEAEDQGRKMILELSREKREVEVNVTDEQTFIDVLGSEGMPLDGVLVFNKGDPVPIDSLVRGFDRVTVVNVASGG
jgi:sulfur carrier protein ThiS